MKRSRLRRSGSSKSVSGRYVYGRIDKILGGGTLYQLLVKSKSGSSFSIPVEHRYYNDMVSGEGELEGRDVRFDKQTKAVRFL